jgi:hypothetical protein
VAGFAGRSAVLVLARPRLWPTAVRQAGRLARPRWWRRAPFLPVPDPEYLHFRLETQYGDAEPDPRDLVTYLEWCRSETRLLRNRGRTGRMRRGQAGRRR